jgi:hypothetical protein
MAPALNPVKTAKNIALETTGGRSAMKVCVTIVHEGCCLQADERRRGRASGETVPESRAWVLQSGSSIIGSIPIARWN